MDIKIKHKEVDKKAEIDKLFKELADPCNKINLNCQTGLANLVDAIYKEESKQIESVEISKYPSLIKMVLKTDGKLLGINIVALGKIMAVSYTKSELEQYINTLQLVHSKME
jgi:hypothetical protein